MMNPHPLNHPWTSMVFFWLPCPALSPERGCWEFSAEVS
jgi:hypothetical protein